MVTAAKLKQPVGGPDDKKLIIIDEPKRNEEEPAEMREVPPPDAPQVRQPQKTAEAPSPEADWQTKRDYMLERLEMLSLQIKESQKETWLGSRQFKNMAQTVERFKERLNDKATTANDLNKMRQQLLNNATAYTNFKLPDGKSIAD